MGKTPLATTAGPVEPICRIRRTLRQHFTRKPQTLWSELLPLLRPKPAITLLKRDKAHGEHSYRPLHQTEPAETSGAEDRGLVKDRWSHEGTLEP
jgi:hypothetical protein